MQLYKILLAFPILAFGFAMDADAGYCERFSPGASKHRDEFLYVTRSYYQNKDAYGCGEYEVDGYDHGCSAGAKIYVTGEHYNDNNEAKGSASALSSYSCVTSGNDHWAQSDLSLIKWCGHYTGVTYLQRGFFEDGEKVYKCSNRVESGSNFCVAPSVSDVCYRCKKELACQTGGGKWVNETGACNGSCSCSHKKDAEWNSMAGKCVLSAQACKNRGGKPQADGTCDCDSGEAFDKATGRCKPKKDCTNCDNITITLENVGNSVAQAVQAQEQRQGSRNTNNNANNNENHNNSDNQTTYNNVTSSCRSSRSTPEGKACCSLSKNVATFDEKNNKCVCSGGKTFSITSNGRGQCTVDGGNGGGNGGSGGNGGNGGGNGGVTSNNCDCLAAQEQMVVAEYTCKDVKGVDINKINEQIIAECDKPSCNQGTVNGLVSILTKEMEKCTTVPEVPVAPVKPTIDTEKLKKAIADIDNFKSSLDVSVWKDAEGNFNTARLVSDSVAGVVLGTAGGLITSSVVKKNQLKKGFEDIVCTVGGQVVGNYGDDINVGIR